jgi:hypothetical protein
MAPERAAHPLPDASGQEVVMKLQQSFAAATLIIGSLSLSACGSPDGPDPGTTTPVGSGPGAASPSPSTAPPPAALAAPPVVTVAVRDNQNVEFYDDGNFAVVRETGPAGSLPMMAGMDPKTMSVVDVFRTLRPDLPVPQALADIRDRLAGMSATNKPRLSPPGSSQSGGLTMPATTQTESGGVTVEQSAQLVGCNNGCCDPAWLPSVFPDFGRNYCNGGGCEWSMFNYGWSYEIATNIGFTNDWVCAATGTSAFQYTWCAGPCVQHNWNVAQATWQNIMVWEGDLSIDFWAYVNSSTSPHMHTHSGNLAW